MIRAAIASCLAASLALGACKGDKKKQGEPDDTVAEPTDQPIPHVDLLPLGVESPRIYSYRWGNGREAYEKAVELAGVAKPDWAAVATASAEAIAADKNHLPAHRLRGVALARTGKAAEAVEHFSIALAADWLDYGPELESDQLLSEFFETPPGKALSGANRRYEEAFKSAAAGGVLVIAKRSRFKMPDKEGDIWAASRAEIYAYSLETDRYLRLTHTGESILGYVTSPDGSRIAYLRASRYRFPPADEGGAPRFLDARVGVLDADSFEPIGEEARLSEPSVGLMLYYTATGELSLQSPDAVYSVDFEGGNLNASSATPIDDFSTLYRRTWTELERPVLYADITMARVLHPSRAAGQINSRAIKLASGKSVRLPDSGGESIRRPTLSPGGKHVAFVGVADACAKPEAALYVADVATAEPTFIHRGKALHGTRWLDGDRLLFEATPSELRLYDLTQKRIGATVKNRAGISFDATSNVVTVEHCDKPAEPVAPAPEPADSSDPSGPGGGD
jgi:hypothetical protein